MLDGKECNPYPTDRGIRGGGSELVYSFLGAVELNLGSIVLQLFGGLIYVGHPELKGTTFDEGDDTPNPRMCESTLNIRCHHTYDAMTN